MKPASAAASFEAARQELSNARASRYARDMVKHICRAEDFINAAEAQQTDDTLSGLRTQIEARIKVLEGHHARWVLGGHKLDIVASQEHIHGLAEALSFIDSAEARKKK